MSQQSDDVTVRLQQATDATVPVWQVLANDLTEHKRQDSERFSTINGRLDRIDAKLDRLLLTLVGSAITIVVLLAGVLLGGGLR